MLFDSYFEAILMSSPGNWTHLEGEPLYNYTAPAGETLTLYSFRPNLAIAVVIGPVCNPNFQEPWTLQFPDQNAVSEYLSFFYSGSLIYRDIVVSVDGHRAILPIPDPQNHSVPRHLSRLLRILSACWQPAGVYDGYIQRASIVESDDRWPA
ncbi:MAG TPA: hypothetical protein VHC69_06795 [Polyangiaceae bacterium]|nr:hypothetical protein [Polyangiaceae bacterium]